ncbi:hypothetical protein [Rubrivirga sp. IMCC43871]|uniref:hypothetical protein n=1 Tax=Rubrivirga sp. IMCC43871 TaxID=3391575 RepID=UPI00398FCEF2
MPRFLLLALCAVVLAACADAQSPTSSADATVLVVDGREANGTASDPTGWDASPALQEAMRDARQHWATADPNYEEETRVLAVAEGAFTRPGVRERAALYLMALWPRCCPKLGLAVIGADDRLVQNVAFEGSFQGVQTVPDLDEDGLDELVLTGTFGMGGDVTGSAVLASFRPEGLVGRGAVETFQSGCAASRPSESSVKVMARLGTPGFTAERFTRPCDSATWTSEGSPEPVLFEGTGGTFTVLPVR